MRELLTKNLLKTYLVGEIAFYSIYLIMTRNIFVLYLVSIELDMFMISTIVFLSTLISTIISIVVHKHPRILISNINEKFILTHALEKILFIPIGFTSNPIAITILYGAVNITSIFSTIYTNLAIYGLFEEADIKDVIAKRTITANITNILGYILTMFLIYSLPSNVKFQTIYTLGGLIGVLSTISILPINLKNVMKAKILEQVSSPERLFTTSYYFITLLTSSNLLGLVWTPFLIRALKSPDYIVIAVNFAGSIAGIFSSIFWAKTSLKKLRISLGLASLTPILCIITHYPILHIGISAYGGFTFVGANFLGSFLFARYKNWLGVLRVSTLMSLITNLSQLLATPFGLLFQEDYTLLFLASAVVRLLSITVAYLTIVEVAIVSEEDARTYSQILYRNSLWGYILVTDVVKESIMITLKVLAIITIFLLLFIVYRFLFFIMSIS
ncbi:MAG: hypothetical protein NZ929_00155 [Aigarchaeota archaeon]|nr:hypothetical protein [Aigarchaeota archaeon]